MKKTSAHREKIKLRNLTKKNIITISIEIIN